MPLFPLFLDMQGKHCMVFGGGRVACRKIRTLLRFGPEVHVFAKEYIPELEQMIQTLKIHKVESDGQKLPSLQGMDMVICATSDEALNHEIAQQCKALDIPVNSATGKGDSTFIFPAVVMRGDVVVGVSSSGQVPAMTKQVRREIESALPEWYGAMLTRMEAVRLQAMVLLPTQKEREVFLSRAAAYGFEHQGDIPDCYIDALLEDIHA